MVVLAALAVAASAAPSLRGEFARQAPRVFNGTVVVAAGFQMHAGVHTRHFQFVDDATGLSFELTWVDGATKVPRQSMHGTLDATFDGTTYSATHFEPGTWAASEFFVRALAVSPSVCASRARGAVVARPAPGGARSGGDGDLCVAFDCALGPRAISRQSETQSDRH